MLSVSVILLSGLVVSHIQRLLIFTLSLFELGGCVCGEHLYFWSSWAATQPFLYRAPWYNARIYSGQ